MDNGMVGGASLEIVKSDQTHVFTLGLPWFFQWLLGLHLHHYAHQQKADNEPGQELSRTPVAGFGRLLLGKCLSHELIRLPTPSGTIRCDDLRSKPVEDGSGCTRLRR
jgi:hypothetical protein